MLKQKEIPKSFIGFLVLSTLIWFVLNLSKTYSTSIPLALVYEKLPQDKVLLSDPLKSVNVQIKGTGFNLFLTGFKTKQVVIPINKLKRGQKKRYYLLLKDYKEDIQQQLSEGTFLSKVLIDTLFFNLGQLATKKVAVKPNLSLTYKLGYDAANNIVINPDTVSISGAQQQLEKIQHVFLEKFSLNEVSKDINKTLKIVPPTGFGDVKMSSAIAKLAIEVDKYTEGEFELPVSVEHFPVNRQLTIYPKKVKVLFKVGLKNFNKITPDVFEVKTNYNYAKENNLSFMLVDLKIKSNLVSSVRVVPDKIDFLIHK